MSKKAIDIGRLISEETEKRLAEMDKPDYPWPEQADKKDAIAIAASVAVCGILILLCMFGVIV